MIGDINFAFLTWNCSWTHNPQWFMFTYVPFSYLCNIYRQIVIFSSWFINYIYWMDVLCYCFVTYVSISIIWNAQSLLFTYSWTEKPRDHVNSNMRVCPCKLSSRSTCATMKFYSFRMTATSPSIVSCF